MELLKSLLTCGFWKRERQTWTMFSKLKALVDSEKFQVIVFQYGSKNDNLEFSLPSIAPHVIEKF